MAFGCTKFFRVQKNYSYQIFYCNPGILFAFSIVKCLNTRFLESGYSEIDRYLFIFTPK